MLLDEAFLVVSQQPNVEVPAEGQLLDGVTGKYISHRIDGEWSEPERVVLVDPGELSLDGCQFIQGNVLWFCSASVGNYRGIDLWTAEYQDGVWTNWQNAGEKLTLDYWAGEMHISSDKNAFYFHSDREDGVGGIDIWASYWIDGEWAEPRLLFLVYFHLIVQPTGGVWASGGSSPAKTASIAPRR